MSTWVVRVNGEADGHGSGPRLAVKDCIDVAGLPTTAGCPVVAEMAEPAEADAAVVASAREGGARIVGKTGLTELCWSASGINHWAGTPVNPRDPRRLPGGSSSGSAVAVATGEADVALGTDTGGSVRVPAGHRARGRRHARDTSQPAPSPHRNGQDVDAIPASDSPWV